MNQTGSLLRGKGGHFQLACCFSLLSATSKAVSIKHVMFYIKNFIKVPFKKYLPSISPLFDQPTFLECVFQPKNSTKEATKKKIFKFKVSAVALMIQKAILLISSGATGRGLGFFVVTSLLANTIPPIVIFCH